MRSTDRLRSRLTNAFGNDAITQITVRRLPLRLSLKPDRRHR